MSSILSEQNLHTLRRRNIGRRWPSLPCAPAALLPPPPPGPFLPFIACPPRPDLSDRRDRHPARRAGLRRAGDPAGAPARRGGGGTSRCGAPASARRRPAPRRRVRPGGG